MIEFIMSAWDVSLEISKYAFLTFLVLFLLTIKQKERSAYIFVSLLICIVPIVNLVFAFLLALGLLAGIGKLFAILFIIYLVDGKEKWKDIKSALRKKYAKSIR